MPFVFDRLYRRLGRVYFVGVWRTIETVRKIYVTVA